MDLGGYGNAPAAALSPLRENGVALVPGAAFGDDRWVRLSYAAATSDIGKGVDRIVAFAKKLGD